MVLGYTKEQIADVQSEIEEIVDNARVKKILFADRFPFLYFTQEFGLDYDAAFAGCAGDTEPSARVIASLIEEIQSENIKAIYHVEMGNTKTAQMIQEATGVEILELHSCHTVTSKQLQEGEDLCGIDEAKCRKFKEKDYSKMLFECKKVSFGYENQQVIKDLSFQVQEGEYVCVVGENGSGKSTLIKGLLGLIPAGSGQVNYGKEISNHVIGYLPQQTSSQKDFTATVWEVILSGCLSTRKGRFFYSKEDKEKARRQMCHLELESLASRPFGALSGEVSVLIADLRNGKSFDFR